MDKVLAWHFTNGRKLRDGQKLVVGKTYTHPGQIILCPDDHEAWKGGGGYHGSKLILDAAVYAPGTMLSRVETWGDNIQDVDKFVARNRTVLWAIDADMLLHEFVCRVAEIALKNVEDIDPRCLKAIEIKRGWMKGEVSDKEMEEAHLGLINTSFRWRDTMPWAVAWLSAGVVEWKSLGAVMTVIDCAGRISTGTFLNDETWGEKKNKYKLYYNAMLEAMVIEAHESLEAI